MKTAGARGAGTVELVPGPRVAEARLLEWLAARCAEARAEPALLRLPVRVVVPSRSLRLHLSERIAAELGATVGVAVQTLHAVALEVLERAGQRAGGGEALVEVLARRAARREPALAEACAPFRDGYRAVVASVRDLLDAGLSPELVEPLTERLAETSVPTADLRRAQAVVRAAGVVAGELLARDHAGRALSLARAREVLLEDPARRLPSRALSVHGFADLTGRAADLVEALVSRAGARVIVDLPPDPIGRAVAARSGEGSSPSDDPRQGRADAGGEAFAGRFVERLAGVAGRPAPPPPRAPAPRLDLFKAPGASAEVREVGRRLRAALAAGARPERCAIVARDLTPYRAALRSQLARLGVPISGLGARAPLDGPGRRLLALQELLERGGETATDRWLDAVRAYPVPDPAGEGGAPGWRSPGDELRLGLRIRGGPTLAQVPDVQLPPGAEDLALPLRRGVGRLTPRPDEGRPDEGGPGARAQASAERGGFVAFRAKLRAPELRAVQELAAATLARLEGWGPRASFARHLEELDRLRASELGWRPGDAEERRVRDALADLAHELADEELDRDEFLTVVTSAWKRAVEPPLAGQGGGVQVLDAMEARARTFDHLFVLGLHKGSFPRTAAEDPLLPDTLRAALAELLPEVPVKARGRDEERYLFAQLVDAAPRVTLSWQVSDDDGRPRVVSPLLVRILGEAGDEDVPQVPRLHEADAPGPHTAHEAALLGGLALRTVGHRQRLQVALEEQGAGSAQAAVLARARTQVLEAFEGGPFEPLALAPWLGLIGPQAEGELRPDPRVEPIYVTRLEALARCPWQTLLTRYLRLELQPDPGEELPSVDRRVLGNVVHRVLEEVAVAAGVPTHGRLEDVLALEGRTVEWPPAEQLDTLLVRLAAEELGQDRVPLAGHVRLMAECAREVVVRARGFLEGEARRFEQVRVLGVEVAGRARVDLGEGLGEVTIDFEADRVERREGHLVLSDYKTGKPLEEKRYPAALAAGRALQPAVYTLAADGGARSRGRYLYVRAEDAEVEVGRGIGIGQHAVPFARAVRTLLAAWTEGALFPRLVGTGGKEPEACSYCEVSEACLRGDSGARRALEGLAAEGERVPDSLGALFRIGEPDDEEGDEGGRGARRR